MQTPFPFSNLNAIFQFFFYIKKYVCVLQSFKQNNVVMVTINSIVRRVGVTRWNHCYQFEVVDGGDVSKINWPSEGRHCERIRHSFRTAWCCDSSQCWRRSCERIRHSFKTSWQWFTIWRHRQWWWQQSQQTQKNNEFQSVSNELTIDINNKCFC